MWWLVSLTHDKGLNTRIPTTAGLSTSNRREEERELVKQQVNVFTTKYLKK